MSDRWLLVVAAVAVGLAWYLATRGVVLVAPIYLTAAVSLVAGVVILARRPRGNPSK